MQIDIERIPHYLYRHITIQLHFIHFKKYFIVCLLWKIKQIIAFSPKYSNKT